MDTKKEIAVNIRIPRSLEKYLFTFEVFHGLTNNRSRAIRRILEGALRTMMKKEEIENKLLELDNTQNEIQQEQENQVKKIREECESSINRIQRESGARMNEISMRIKNLKYCLENEEFYIPGSKPSCAEKILVYPYLWHHRHNSPWLDAPAGQSAFDSLNISKTEFKDYYTQ